VIHLKDPALDRLVVRANLGSSSGMRALWFTDCHLKGSVLFVPNEDVAGFIGRCFLEKMRAVVTDLEIRVGVAEPASAVPSKLWKKGKEPRQGGML
jgi:hypothetical protein